MATRLLPFANGRLRCIECGADFDARSSPLADWHMCSNECANADRRRRYRAPRPPGDAEAARARIEQGPPFAPELRPWIDFLEELAQVRRERAVQAALNMRHRTGHDLDALPDPAWFVLAEADLGNYKPAELVRRIGELVQFYRGKVTRGTALLDLEGARARLWAFVPVRLAEQITR